MDITQYGDGVSPTSTSTISPSGTNPTTIPITTPPGTITSKQLLFVNGQEQYPMVDYLITGGVLYWISKDFNLSSTDTINIYYLT